MDERTQAPGRGRGLRRESVPVVALAVASGLAVGRATARAVGPLASALTGLVAFDVVGGMVSLQQPHVRATFQTSPVVSRLLFVAAHLQPFMLPLTGQGGLALAAGRYAAALASTAAIEVALPRHPARRGIAAALGLALAVVDVRCSRGSAQRWLGPVYLLKLVAGHAGIPRGRGIVLTRV